MVRNDKLLWKMPLHQAYAGDLADSAPERMLPSEAEADIQACTIAIQDPAAEAAPFIIEETDLTAGAEGTTTELPEASQVKEVILGTALAFNTDKGQPAEAETEDLHPITIPSITITKLQHPLWNYKNLVEN